jgi:flavin reductase (DIM6/NTAB) family NADH-FMN oxidoreductase RutF
MFSANQNSSGVRKDTTINAERTGEFVWNLATYPLRNAVNISAEETPYGTDEFARAGLQKEKASIVNVNMVKESPVKFECKYHSTIRLPGNPPVGTCDVVIGLVVGIHVDERVLTDGLVDIGKTEPIARCGYFQYARIKETFEMVIPGDGKVLLGLEGSVRGYAVLRDEMVEKDKIERNGEEIAK